MARPGQSLLVICHPSQELRVFGWMSEAQPDVCVLTDGSGSKGRPRLEFCRLVLKEAKARPGLFFGQFTDIELYRRLVTHDHGFFITLAETLACHLEKSRVVRVVADNAEGFNPGQDVCRLVVDTAVQLATRRSGRQIENFGVTISGDPGLESANSLRVCLSAENLERKLSLALAYSGLEEEMAWILAKFGREAFAVEILNQVKQGLAITHRDPVYEAYGTSRVGAGTYGTVIRYADHMAPLLWALRVHLQGPTMRRVA